MSNTNLIEQHQVALDGLKLNTAKLMSFAQSRWTWLNPKPNRVRINELIRELVSYYKALDRARINSCSNEIDLARVAIYEALTVSAESPKEQGTLIVAEMHSRVKKFDTVLEDLRLDLDKVPAYVMPLSEAVLAPQPMPVNEPKPQGPSFWESCKNFFSGLWNALKSFSSIFIPAKPDLTVAIIVPKPAPFLPPASSSINQNIPPANHSSNTQEWPVLRGQTRQPREPGTPVSRQYFKPE